MKVKQTSNSLVNTLTLASLGSLTALSVAIPQAEAFTIVRNFIEPTEPFPGLTGINAGNAPSNTAGGGNLVDIFNTAADIWEDLIEDDHTLTVNFGWAPLNGKAIHDLVNQGGTPNRETEATIRFDNDESFSWFLDSTPHLSEEFQDLMARTENLGGGAINVERRYSSPVSGSAAVGRRDLLQTAMHEIGHALGMSNANSSYGTEIGDGDVDITLPLPFDGSSIPVDGSHFPDQLGKTLMWGGGLPGNERRYPSAVDILANAQVSQFTQINLEPGVEGTANATFSNPDPNCPPATCTGIGTNSITWGIPTATAPGGLPNSLSIGGGEFTGELGTPFVAGTISYFNGSVLAGSEISGVDLALETLIDIPTLGIEDLALSDLRQVTINNTLNIVGDPEASADFLSIVPPSGAGASFGNNFHVLEGNMATAELFGRIILQDIIDDGDVVPFGSPMPQEGEGDGDPVGLNDPPSSQTPPQKFAFEVLGFGKVIDGEGFITSSTSIPEPSTVLGTGLAWALGILSLRRKKKT